MAGFDHSCAWHVGCSLAARARDEALPIAISIRRNGQTLFSAAMPGTSRDNDDWLKRKAQVVDRFGHSSLFIRESILGGEMPPTAELDLPTARYALYGGSFPIVVTRTGVVGSVTVSGLAHTSDHQLVVDALEAHVLSHHDGSCQHREGPLTPRL